MKYTIFSEGKWDQSFIRDYLVYLLGQEAYDSFEFEFVSTGGWTNLAKVAPKLQQTTDIGGKNLVLFDADFPHTYGGFQSRESELNALKSSLNIEFDLFLFPNNQDDGIFEHLLERIVCENHQCIVDCFHDYEDCIVRNNQANIYNVPIQKSKVFAYIETVSNPNEFEKSRKNYNLCFSNLNYWNLDSGHIEPLKSFFNRNLTQPAP